MPKFTRRSSRPSKAKTISYLLESGSVKDIRQAKEITNELLKYHWTYYSELAREMKFKIRFSKQLCKRVFLMN
jgi:hypothetical protein